MERPSGPYPVSSGIIFRKRFQMVAGRPGMPPVSLTVVLTFLYFSMALLGQKLPWQKEWSFQSLEPRASKRTGHKGGREYLRIGMKKN